MFWLKCDPHAWLQIWNIWCWHITICLSSHTCRKTIMCSNPCKHAWPCHLTPNHRHWKQSESNEYHSNRQVPQVLCCSWQQCAFQTWAFLPLEVLQSNLVQSGPDLALLASFPTISGANVNITQICVAPNIDRAMMSKKQTPPGPRWNNFMPSYP